MVGRKNHGQEITRRMYHELGGRCLEWRRQQVKKGLEVFVQLSIYIFNTFLPHLCETLFNNILTHVQDIGSDLAVDVVFFPPALFIVIMLNGSDSNRLSCKGRRPGGRSYYTYHYSLSCVKKPCFCFLFQEMEAMLSAWRIKWCDIH